MMMHVHVQLCVHKWQNKQQPANQKVVKTVLGTIFCMCLRIKKKQEM